jgi:hypothetical protein
MSLLLFLVRFLSDFFIFFDECNLFSLRNMPTKFCEPAVSGCKVKWKVSENIIIAFYGAFFVQFL